MPAWHNPESAPMCCIGLQKVGRRRKQWACTTQMLQYMDQDPTAQNGAPPLRTNPQGSVADQEQLSEMVSLLPELTSSALSLAGLGLGLVQVWVQVWVQVPAQVQVRVQAQVQARV
jgi:hypothetical protein